MLLSAASKCFGAVIVHDATTTGFEMIPAAILTIWLIGPQRAPEASVTVYYSEMEQCMAALKIATEPGRGVRLPDGFYRITHAKCAAH